MATAANQSEQSELRGSSYIYVATPSPRSVDANPLETVAHTRRRKPRCSMLLPLLALVDGLATISLGTVVYGQELHSHDRAKSPELQSMPTHAASRERQKVILVVVAVSLARVCAYAMVGFSRDIRQQGVLVAAMSVLSSLFYVSIANMLFQARSKHDRDDPARHRPYDHDRWHWTHAFRHVHPTLAILLGMELALTFVEWIVYIAVVGVRLPPGSSSVRAKRWARSVFKKPSYQHSAETQYLTASDPEVLAQAERDQNEPDLHGDASSPLCNISPGHSDTSTAAGRKVSGYGTMLDEPRTPPSHRYSRFDTNSEPSSRYSLPATQIGSRQSELYARSPDSAELGPDRSLANDADDSMTSGDLGSEEEDEVVSDPDDIVDVTPNRKVARQEARLRLAHAALPGRRPSGGALAGLNLFGASSSSSTPLKPSQWNSTNVFDSPGSHKQVSQNSAQLPISTSSGAFSISSMAPSASSDSVFPASSGANTPSSSRSSFKYKKLRLPKWIKPKRKDPSRP